MPTETRWQGMTIIDMAKRVETGAATFRSLIYERTCCTGTPRADLDCGPSPHHTGVDVVQMHACLRANRVGCVKMEGAARCWTRPFTNSMASGCWTALLKGRNYSRSGTA